MKCFRLVVFLIALGMLGPFSVWAQGDLPEPPLVFAGYTKCAKKTEDKIILSNERIYKSIVLRDLEAVKQELTQEDANPNGFINACGKKISFIKTAAALLEPDILAALYEAGSIPKAEVDFEDNVSVYGDIVRQISEGTADRVAKVITLLHEGTRTPENEEMLSFVERLSRDYSNGSLSLEAVHEISDAFVAAHESYNPEMSVLFSLQETYDVITTRSEVWPYTLRLIDFTKADINGNTAFHLLAPSQCLPHTINPAADAVCATFPRDELAMFLIGNRLINRAFSKKKNNLDYTPILLLSRGVECRAADPFTEDQQARLYYLLTYLNMLDDKIEPQQGGEPSLCSGVSCPCLAE